MSVIIPVFNGGRWISAAVDSALGQTYRRLEVVVVDDGSTDDTAERIRQKYGSRVRYVFQANRGLSAARNRGLELAQGEYVQFLDADDLLAPQKVALHVEFLETNPAPVGAYCDYTVFDDDAPEVHIESPGHRRKKYGQRDTWLALLSGNYIVCHALLLRRAPVIAAGGFDEKLKACEDYDLWLRLAGSGQRFEHVGGALVAYRQHANSMTRQRISQLSNERLVLQKARRYRTTISPEDHRFLDAHAARIERALAHECRRIHQGVQAMLHECRAWWLEPENLWALAYHRLVGR